MDKEKLINASSPITDEELFHISDDKKENAGTQTVSGIGITAQPAVNEEDNLDLIQAINKQNAKEMDALAKEQEELEEQKRQEYERIVQERQAAIFEERAKEEAAERERILAEEAEEERRREEEAQRNTNILKSFFTKRPQSQEAVEVPEAMTEETQPTTPEETAFDVPEPDDTDIPESALLEEAAEEAFDTEEEPAPEPEQPKEETAPEIPQRKPKIRLQKPKLQKETQMAQETTESTPTEPVEEEKPKKQKREKPVRAPKQKPERTPKPAPAWMSLFNRKPKEATESGGTNWKFLATHDKLTGLLNKEAFLDEKGSMKRTMSMIAIDCGRLGIINDVNGYDKGTEVISNVAKTLKQVSNGKVYRIDGGTFYLVDEFTSKEHMLSFINMLQNRMNALSTPEIPYILYTGICYNDGLSFLEVCNRAEKDLAEKKEAYKKAHAPREKEELSYDDRLSANQRTLKRMIQNEHCPISKEAFQRNMASIEDHVDDILFILMASGDFDNLFIFFDPENFLDLIGSVGDGLDYSYLYAIHQGGALYYGSDEYYDQVTRLFQDISDALRVNSISAKSIAKIKGINIFQHIFVAE